MLFNSYGFALVFLPIVLLGFYWIGRYRTEPAIAWLVLCSLFFYGWWKPVYLWLLLLSILVNYACGRRLASNGRVGPRWRRVLLVVGIAFNLGLLAYFKYANFFVDSVNRLSGSDLTLATIVLPLAISFYTFQQIAYLVDVYRREAKEYSFLHYCLFVTFFPQLIAGPIVHHKEMLPQFSRQSSFRLVQDDLAVGLTLFVFGLFKKVVLADGMAVYATPAFSGAASGIELSFFEAWGGALAYSLQLYFDFSGYSDMAIGLGRLFGIRLPINFNSPYRAVNIIDFWRRWHITLSRFLRDYLYIPLGGNRRGPSRRYLNLILTMLLGGLWHGAGWTFVIWGGLHGVYLAINHLWHALRRRIGIEPGSFGVPGRVLARALTLLAITVGWVVFRSADWGTAESILRSMAGLDGIGLPAGLEAAVDRFAPGIVTPLGLDYGGMFPHDLVHWASGIPWMILLTLVALFAPNTIQLMRHYAPALQSERVEADTGLAGRVVWRPTGIVAGIVAALFIWSLLTMTSVSEFLYFQF